MADVLSVIADIIKQDKQQKREHNKIMREVKKKMKEAEVSEEDGPGDGDEYQKFVRTMLKKFGVKSPSELAPDKKKEFYDALDAGWEGDDEKPEPEDEQTDLGTRVKARMEAENEEEEDEDGEEGIDDPNDMSDSDEDEDDDPVGDPDEDEAAEEDDEEEVDMDEPSEEQIDKIADLVVQKLKDKAEDEKDEEEEPESTEAEAGEEEEIDTKPKVEGTIHRNPHHRGMWEEALKRVYEEKVPTPIPEIIKSVGKQLRDYALKSGGIDKNDFLRVSDVMQKGKIPKASLIPDDTDPREFVMDLMAKTFGWKFVEQEYNMRFNRRHDYVESFQGGEVLQEHCGECGAMDHVDEKKMFSGKGEFEVKYASSKRGPIKVSKFNTLDDAKKFLAQVKGEGMNGIISKGGKPVKEEVEIDEKKSDYEDQIKAFLAKGGKIQKGDRPNKKKIDKVTNAFLKRYGAMKKKEAELDAKDKEELEKMMGEAIINEAWIDNDARKVERKWSKMDKKAKKKWMDGVMAKAKKEGMPKDELMDVLDDYGLTMEEESNLEKLERWGIKLRKEDYVKDPGDSHIDPDIDKDNDLPKNWSSKGIGKPPVTDQKRQDTEDRRAKRVEPVTKKGGPKPGNGGELDSGTVKRIEGDNQNKLSVGTKSGKGKPAMGKATNAKIPERVKTKDGVSTAMEGYMVLPAIDRNKYTPMRGMEGPFPTMSGKVLYYDPKAGQYYDRDSDIYISYDQYMEYDKMSSSQRKQMDMGPLGDPKSKEYKAMERVKNKAEKMAKKNRLKAKNESVGMRFIRKHYQKDNE